MINTKEYKGGMKNILAYGMTGSGKSTAFLTYPGKKFCYVFDPAGLETFAGHDVDVEQFVPETLQLKTQKLSKGSKKSSKIIAPDPETYLRFEEHLEKALNTGFLDNYDIVGFESLTTLLDMQMWYILHAQGRDQAAPEIQDYYFRKDGLGNLVRAVTAIRKVIYFSAHIETAKDDITSRIETSISLPGKIQTALPLLFSEVLPFFAEPDRDGKVRYYVQLKPTVRMPLVRTSLKTDLQRADITVDWSKPLEGQGFFGLWLSADKKTAEERKKEETIVMA